MKTILVTRDTKGKCRVIEMSLIKNEDETYTITRFSGLIDGKRTEQPSLKITKGKVKRDTKTQAELEYNSLIKKAKDKGYKDIADLGITDLADVDNVLPKNKTDTKGVLKPMLCKVYDPNDKKNEGKTWWISRKLDGVRSFLYYKDGELLTSSRGGQNYDIPTTYIRNDEFLKSLFEHNPDLILDGELFIRYKPLSYISGLCRLETLDEKHLELKFHCYDVVDETKSFKDRLLILNDIKQKLNTDKLVIVDHYKINDDSEIDNYHNQFVADGYEGAVIRDENECYKCGARDRRMQKIKKFSDSDFLIKDLVEGLRDEDMCFLMETKEGYEFKAKPIGDRELKQWYRNNIDNIIGKYGTVKYFGYTTTDTPVPNLPVFKAIRDIKDI